MVSRSNWNITSSKIIKEVIAVFRFFLFEVQLFFSSQYDDKLQNVKGQASMEGTIIWSLIIFQNFNILLSY